MPRAKKLATTPSKTSQAASRPQRKTKTKQEEKKLAPIATKSKAIKKVPAKATKGKKKKTEVKEAPISNVIVLDKPAATATDLESMV